MPAVAEECDKDLPATQDAHIRAASVSGSSSNPAQDGYSSNTKPRVMEETAPHHSWLLFPGTVWFVYVRCKQGSMGLLTVRWQNTGAHV